MPARARLSSLFSIGVDLALLAAAQCTLVARVFIAGGVALSVFTQAWIVLPSLFISCIKLVGQIFAELSKRAAADTRVRPSANRSLTSVNRN